MHVVIYICVVQNKIVTAFPQKMTKRTLTSSDELGKEMNKLCKRLLVEGPPATFADMGRLLGVRGDLPRWVMQWLGPTDCATLAMCNKEWYSAISEYTLQRGMRCIDNTKPSSLCNAIEPYYNGTPRLDEAVLWWEKAAEAGSPEAAALMARCCYSGCGVAMDRGATVKWARASAEAGCAEGQFWLGRCYYHGRGVAVDHARAASLWSELADTGHADAQFRLGSCYFWGHGVAKDRARARKLWEAAAAQGYTRSVYTLLGV